MSAVRCPVVIENFHIFHSGQCENTFNMSAKCIAAQDVVKIEIIREQTNTHWWSIADI